LDNSQKIQNNFNRFAGSYDKYAIVQKEIAKRLYKKLSIINPLSNLVLELGAGTGLLSDIINENNLKNKLITTDFALNSLSINNDKNSICLDSHYLPFKPKIANIVISNLMMQWCNLEAVALEAQRVLTNDGLFIFSTFGPQTLTELKQSWSEVDNKTHANNFMDMHDIGDKLLALGFSGVVVESEIITLTYEKAMDILLDLKNIGAQNINAKNITKSNLKSMFKNYEKFRTNGKLPISYEVIYAHGFKKSPNKFNTQTIDKIGF